MMGETWEFFILFFIFVFHDAEMKTTFILFSFLMGHITTLHQVRSFFPFCLLNHIKYFNYIAAIWAFKKKENECCSSITVKPQSFVLFCIGDEHICRFTVVCCCIVKKWKLLFIQIRTSLLKSTFTVNVSWNGKKTVIVHCKYCYCLIKCIRSVMKMLKEDLVDLLKQRDGRGCVCNSVCVWLHLHLKHII